MIRHTARSIDWRRRARFKLTGWRGSLRLVLDHPSNRGHGLQTLSRFIAWQLWKVAVRRPLTTRFWRDVRLVAYPDSPISSAAICTRLPEYDDMLFLTRVLRPGETFVDVGANVGMYSLLAASIVGDGTVLAIEPDPRAAARLAANARLNLFERIAVRQVAAGASIGRATLTADLDVMNHIVEGVREPTTVSRGSRGVELTTLDAETASYPAVSVVKVDAEGFETQVLMGARRLLSRPRPPAWIVEVNGFGSRYGESDAAITGAFAASGYRPFRYAAADNRLIEVDPAVPAGGPNLIFSRDPDDLRRRLSHG